MKSYTVRFRPRARRDLIGLYRYLESRFSDDAAADYIRKIDAACLALESAPLRGIAVSGGMTGLRILGFERRVSVLFRVNEETVEILRVLYGGRDLSIALRSIPH